MNQKISLRLFRIFITFVLISFAWIFFRMPSVSSGFAVVSKILTDGFNSNVYTALNTDKLFYVMGIFILVFKDVHDEFLVHRFNILNIPVVRRVIYLLLFVLIIMTGVLDSGQFIYVSF